MIEKTPELLDSDNDGVNDLLDECPTSQLQDIVNQVGCDLFHGVVKDVHFETDGLELTEAARLSLDVLVKGLLDYPDMSLDISAHTDNRGTAVLNLELSKKRVMAAVAYLVSQGVTSSRLKPHGYGESRPIAPNATEEGRQLNRRIEVEPMTKE